MRHGQLMDACLMILGGLNIQMRPGLKSTPERFAKAWEHWAAGYCESVSEVMTTFEDGAENYDQFVIVRNIPIYSHCEHHLAPFFGQCHIGYIPNKRILGLSKFARLADIFARRLQVQERLTSEIAEAINIGLEPKGVGVVIECRHLCMESRGISVQGTTTVTSAIRGILRTDASAKAEFLQLVGR